MWIVDGLITAATGILVGALIVAFGQVCLAVRDAAINTRKEGRPNDGGEYRLLRGLAKAIHFAGWAVMIVGLVVGIATCISQCGRAAALEKQLGETKTEAPGTR